MTNQVANQQNLFENQTTFNFEVNGNAITLSESDVVNHLVRGNGQIAQQEVLMFMNQCKFQQLNPFVNEAYLVKYGSQPAQIIVSKEAFMKRAEANPNYKGFEAGIIVDRSGNLVEIEGAVKLPADNLIGGWCKVYRKDREMPIVSKISLEEFSKGQATWKQMPLTMIRKSAIVNALREAFPENLGAMYTEDDADINKKDITPEQEVQQEIKQNANQEILDIPATKVQPEPKKQPIEAEYTETNVFTEPQSGERENPANGPGF